MKKLRRFLNSWPALLLFLGGPMAILLMWPSGKEAWIRWVLAAPFLVVCLWVVWAAPKDSDD